MSNRFKGVVFLTLRAHVERCQCTIQAITSTACVRESSSSSIEPHAARRPPAIATRSAAIAGDGRGWSSTVVTGRGAHAWGSISRVEPAAPRAPVIADRPQAGLGSYSMQHAAAGLGRAACRGAGPACSCSAALVRVVRVRWRGVLVGRGAGKRSNTRYRGRRS